MTTLPNPQTPLPTTEGRHPHLRVLFLLPHLPYPPHAGGTLRSYGMIKGLAERGHEIGLLTFAEPGQQDIDQTPLAALCNPAISVPAPERTVTDRLRDLLAGHTDMARRFWSETFAEALRDLLSHHTFDVIDLYLEMTGYLPVIKECASDAMLIYDALNAEHYLQKRIAARELHTLSRWPLAAYSLIQANRLKLVETKLCQSVQHVLACSGADAETLRTLRHNTPITVIPNAISVDKYQQSAREPVADIAHPALVFTGKMDFRPNVDAALWFTKSIMPIIKLHHPNIHFTIVGQKPHSRLEYLKEQPRVTITGYVPDIKPYIEAADIYVAPLRMGSGTRFKLLEAMAMGKAIVSTRLGAEGLNVEHGKHMLLADTERSFAGAVIDLLSNEHRCRVLGENAARLVKEQYDWEVIIPRLEEVYAQRRHEA
ncbi:MAG: glycosyltransferase [Anaerolineae bacterium]|nr:glycosyltransferase [Anaerolineae bacterium]